MQYEIAEQQSGTLKAALEYADFGYPVIPIYSCDGNVCQCGRPDCKDTGKHPKTLNGLKDATKDKATVKAWFNTLSNVAIVTGDGFFAVDVDNAQSWDDLIAAYGPPPPTLTASSPRGGTHYYFQSAQKIRNSQSKLGPGIDIRGDGGYIIAPPSIGPTGQYEWKNRVKMAPAPVWLEQLAGETISSRTDSMPMPDAVLEGGRTTWLVSLAGTMRRRGMSIGSIALALWKENVARAKPPLSQAEVNKIAGSIDKYVPTDDAGDWRKQLKMGDGGKVRSNASNATIYLKNLDMGPGQHLAYNEFSDEVYWKSDPPEGLCSPSRGPFRESDCIYLQWWLGQNTPCDFRKEHLYEAACAVARLRTTDPLAEWLTGLQWDGVKRVDNWLKTYLGADVEASPVAAQIGKWFLISAVARALTPGCQVDHVLVLEGEGGKGKSSVVRTLAREYYLENIGNLYDTHVELRLQGRWIVEIPEMDSFKGVRRSRIKDFISSTVGTYKQLYVRNFVSRPRRVVFIATVDEFQYLDDPNSRRYWPVRVGRIDLDSLKRDRAQLWAEAVAKYKAGERWYPRETIEVDALEDERASRWVEDPWTPKIVEYLMGQADYVTTESLLQRIGLPIAQADRKHQIRLSHLMSKLGWRQDRLRLRTGGRISVYKPGPKWRNQ